MTDISDYLGGGWQSLEGKDPPPQTDEEKDEDRRVNVAIHTMFSTGDGPIVLEWLRSKTIEIPSFNANLGLVGIAQGLTREGQNSIYHEIIRRMRRAEEGN